jgi:molecular chaperone GrpE (heat shock protein)
MATLPELLKEIKQLLRTLSDRFEELAQNIGGVEPAQQEGEAETAIYSPSEIPEFEDLSDDTQSLEPPPFDELIEDSQEDTKAVDPDEPKTSEMKAVQDETEDTKAIGKDEVPSMAPPSKSGALPLLEKLSRLQEIVEKKGLEVSAKDFAFIPKSTKVYASLSGDDQVGPKGARIVLDCINFLDTITYKFVGEYYAPLRDAVAALTRSLSEFLQREVGYRIFPLEENTRSEIEKVVPDYSISVQEKLTGSKEPAGTVVAVRRRGAILDTNVVRKAQLLISSSEQSEVCSLLGSSLNAVSSLKTDGGRGAEMKLKAMNSLMEWREKTYGLPDDQAVTMARYALNLIYVLENPTGDKAEGMFLGQTQKLRKVNERIVAFLSSVGLTEILVSVGGVFDESYDPSKYERKKVASDKPEGTIVGILRKGFLDRNGIPVQKAVVAVSGK